MLDGPVGAGKGCKFGRDDYGGYAMTSVSSGARLFADLGKTFSGQLLQPADLGYEEARKVHNGLVDKRPGLIAECRGVADVVDAIHLARKLNVEVAVRGGGHNVAGRATIDGGILIDLAPMKGIAVVMTPATPEIPCGRGLGGRPIICGQSPTGPASRSGKPLQSN